MACRRADAQTRCKHTLAAWARALVALALAASPAFLALCPAAAYAYFYDVDTDRKAASEGLPPLDAAIPASGISDGSYEMRAFSTSTMFYIYRSSADAQSGTKHVLAGTNLNYTLVDVNVKSGKMSCTFFVSKAYNRLFLGTAQEAAAHSSDDGLDGSGYLVGSPAEGDVPKKFTVALSGLNQPFYLAAYNGSSKGIAQGKWFLRELVLVPTPDSLAAMKGGGTAKQENGPNGSDGSADKGKKQTGGKSTRDASESSAASRPSAAAGGSGPTGGGGAAGSAEAAGQTGHDAYAPATPYADGIPAVGLAFASGAVQERGADDAQTAPLVAEERSPATFALAITAAFVLMAMAGALYRTLSFRRAKDCHDIVI